MEPPALEREFTCFSERNAIALVLATLLSLGVGRLWPLGILAALSFSSFVVQLRGNWTPTGAFGKANLVTCIRWVSVVLACLAPARTPRSTVTLLALGIFLLDALDGWLARRSGASLFGAHLDMESDALLVLWLALWLHLFGGLGLWPLAAGLLRYGYVLSVACFRARRGNEPRSQFARYGFGAVVIGFLAGVALPNAYGAGLALLGSLWVSLSFGRSFWWAFRREPKALPGGET